MFHTVPKFPYDMLYFLCYVIFHVFYYMLCYVSLRYFTLCYVTLHYATLHYVVTLHCVMLCKATLI